MIKPVVYHKKKLYIELFYRSANIKLYGVSKMLYSSIACNVKVLF